jgi:hypothetical protein
LKAFLAIPADWPTQDRLRRYEFLLAAYFLKQKKSEFEAVAMESRNFAVTYNSGFHLPYVQSLATGLLSRFENG